MRIGKVFTFDAAHMLPKHKGKCKQLHGHTYKLEVVVNGPMIMDPKSTAEGMVMDFSDLKDMVEQVVLINLDHTYLNDKFENPTAELVAARIFVELDGYFVEDDDRSVVKVKLWETPTSYVECRYEDIQHILEYQR